MDKENDIILSGVNKLDKQRITVYRGEGSSATIYTAQDIGKIIALKRFKSTSKERYVAEGFVPNEQESQLLFIEANTARDISKYSQILNQGVPEEELLLLPGTKLKVDKISPLTLTTQDENGETVNYQTQLVNMSEVD